MKDHTAVAQLPGSWTPKWSLSSRDKKRLKQILALIVAIIGLLWLLYQLGQYTVPMGEGLPNRTHADGDRKKSVHAAFGLPHKTFAGGLGNGKRLGGGVPPPVTGARRPTLTADVAGRRETSAAPLSNADYQSITPGAASSDPLQQAAPGSNGENPGFFGYGNSPMPLIFNGGGGPGNSTNNPSTGSLNGSGPGTSTSSPNTGGGSSGSGPSNNASGPTTGGGPSEGGPGNSNGPNGGGPSGGGPGDSTGGSTIGGGPSGGGPSNSTNGPSSGGPSGGGPDDSTGGPTTGGGQSGGGGPSGNPLADLPTGPDSSGGNSGNGPGDSLDAPPPFGNGAPDGGDGNPSGTPLTNSTSGPTDNDTPSVVDVPEPNSIALFAGGFLVLLTLRRQRKMSRNHARASEKEPASVVPDQGAYPVRGRMRLAAIMGLASLTFVAEPASAETATVYGTTASIFSPNSGAFLPANTNLICFSMNEANCWDGKKWQRLYPSGRRHYATAATDRVTCSVIVAPSNDCWTGSIWYRLPKGQLFGVIGGFFSDTPGAFITAPLRTPRVIYNAASLQSPLGEFASKR